MKHVLPITAMLVLLCSGPVASQGAMSFCAVVEAVPIDTTGPAASGGPIDGRQTLDLRFDVYLDGVPAGDHVVEVELSTPAGHHYQTLVAPATTFSKRAPSRRSVAGFPRPLPVKLLQPASHAKLAAPVLVTFSLPVAGTPMVSSGLYGAWSIEVLVDGEHADCATSNGFALVEKAAIFSDQFEDGNTTAWSATVP